MGHSLSVLHCGQLAVLKVQIILAFINCLQIVKRLAYTKNMKLSAYLSIHGSKTKLARAINAQPQLVWQWATAVRPVPVRRCLAIELETGGVVTRKDLRPDDWQEYWPELAPDLANTAKPATETIAQEE